MAYRHSGQLQADGKKENRCRNIWREKGKIRQRVKQKKRKSAMMSHRVPTPSRRGAAMKVEAA